MLPPLIAAFARAQGLILTLPATPDAATVLVDLATGKILAEFSFRPLPFCIAGRGDGGAGGTDARCCRDRAWISAPVRWHWMR